IQSIEHADLPELRYFRIERDSGKGVISRDVITFSNDTFVIDQFVQESGAEISDEQFRVSWTMSADKVLDDKLSAPAKNHFVFSGAVEDQKLHSQFSGSESTKIELLNKSSNSVLGWVEHEGKVEGAYTLDIQSSITNGTAWIMNASFLEHNTGCTPLATFSNRAISAGTVNSDNNSFTLSVQGCGRDYEVTRNRGVIELNTNTPQRVAITTVPDDFKSEVTRINSVTQDIFDEYGPRFRPLLSYRIKISIFGCVILVVVLLSILLLRYIQLPNRVRSAYMYSTLLAWSGLVVWVSFFYFN
ncbi:MAG: hypothetical protein MI864_02135, partial [Pseudomonadales bacterium]|nr:hypothetical protein [Pseudomonadales bacterium]